MIFHVVNEHAQHDQRADSQLHHNQQVCMTPVQYQEQ